MLEKRLIDLRAAQIDTLAKASGILGRIQECELLLVVLDKKEEKEEVGEPPLPKLVEVDEAT